MNQVSDTDWSYLAGFIDGEGCISVFSSGKKGRYYPRLSIAQADQVQLYELYELFGVGRLSFRRKTKANKATGTGITWNVRNHVQLKWVLEGVMPYLRLKRRQAELALLILDSRMDEALVSELRGCKVPRRPYEIPESR